MIDFILLLFSYIIFYGILYHFFKCVTFKSKKLLFNFKDIMFDIISAPYNFYKAFSIFVSEFKQLLKSKN